MDDLRRQRRAARGRRRLRVVRLRRTPLAEPRRDDLPAVRGREDRSAARARAGARDRASVVAAAPPRGARRDPGHRVDRHRAGPVDRDGAVRHDPGRAAARPHPGAGAGRRADLRRSRDPVRRAPAARLPTATAAGVPGRVARRERRRLDHPAGAHRPRLGRHDGAGAQPDAPAHVLLPTRAGDRPGVRRRRRAVRHRGRRRRRGRRRGAGVAAGRRGAARAQPAGRPGGRGLRRTVRHRGDDLGRGQPRPAADSRRAAAAGQLRRYGGGGAHRRDRARAGAAQRRRQPPAVDGSELAPDAPPPAAPGRGRCRGRARGDARFRLESPAAARRNAARGRAHPDDPVHGHPGTARDDHRPARRAAGP